MDVLIEFPMNRETAAIEPAFFVNEILIGQMKMRYIAAGADLSFGAGGRGDSDHTRISGERSGACADCGLSARYR